MFITQTFAPPPPLPPPGRITCSVCFNWTEYKFRAVWYQKLNSKGGCLLYLGTVHLTSRGGKGAMFFWEKKFSVWKFEGKKISVCDMGRKKISVCDFCSKNDCFCIKKIMSRQLVAKKNFCFAAKRKKIFWLRKKP